LQVKSYGEEAEELEVREEAYRAAQRQKNGYEDTRCEVCDSKVGQGAGSGGCAVALRRRKWNGRHDLRFCIATLV
jgi:hypothetical protein